MNTVSRIGAVALPGGAITFALLMFMVSLIYIAIPAAIITPEINLRPIFHVETQVIPEYGEAKPTRPLQPHTPPDKLVDRQAPTTVLENSIAITFKPPATTIKPLVQQVDTDYIPVYVPQPRFPNRAVSRGISGYAVVEVTITTSGAVRDPQLLEEYPQGYGFGSAALNAASRLKYNPRVVDGIPREVPRVPYKFSFVVDD